MTWTSGMCQTNGIAIHWRRTGGEKPPIVLLHGLTGSGACWSPVARELANDFDVIMPDARGHGASSAPDHRYRYDDLAKDVLGVVRGLDLPGPALLGHSMGGMTAALAAQTSPGTFSALVLVDPTFLEPERQREVHASDVAEQHRRALSLSSSELVAQTRARHPHRSPEVALLQAEARLQTHPVAFDVLTPPSPGYREVMAAIDIPTLLIIGDTDPVVTLEMATELGRASSQLRVAQIERAGHGLPFDQPVALAAATRGFLLEVRESLRARKAPGPTRTAT